MKLTLLGLILLTSHSVLADAHMDRTIKMANARAELVRQVCGEGNHSATIVMGKVTECDGKPIDGSVKNESTPEVKPVAKKEESKINWSLECFSLGKYILCQDGFYQPVNPIVAKALLYNR